MHKDPGKKQKLLLVLRLYTGLESSLNFKTWKPEGVPTIYNFLDRAAKEFDLGIIFTCKDSGTTYHSNWREVEDKRFEIIGLDAKILVLAGRNYFPMFVPRKLGMILRDIRHLLFIISMIFREKPNLVYCDGSNVTFAFCISKLFRKTPVVLRLLGICSFLRNLPKAKRIVHLIYRYAFSAPFASVIATQDGTGSEFFLERVLSKDVPRHVLLNGTDILPKDVIARTSNSNDLEKRKDDLETVLFVGRLEEDKGIRNFILAVTGALKEKKIDFRAIVVGDGSLLKEMISFTECENVSDRIIFTKSVPHSTILDFQNSADIYVSTNYDGNLTNANLEAISSDACMLIPAPQHKKLIDIKTFDYLADSVEYFDVDCHLDLKEKLLQLLQNPARRADLSSKLARRKKDFMRSWDTRVAEEIKILNSLIHRK